MRLFVAAFPDAAAAFDLARMERPTRPGLRWTTPGQWHVTLRFLGSVEGPDPVMAALATGLAGAGAATARAGPVSETLGGALVVPVAGLDALARRVGEATAGIGESRPDRPFRGHLTLARVARSTPVPAAVVGVSCSARWPVDTVAVVRSDTRPEGARYEVLATVPLAP